MSGHAESSAATVGILRNDDALSRALRNEVLLDIDEIVRINRALSPAHDALSSVESSSTAVFSSREESTITKPTSAGASHPTSTHNDRRKRQSTGDYASSLSGTHGSASEAEFERRALRRDNLIAMGEWADPEFRATRTLKGAARAKERQQYRPKPKPKKRAVVIEQRDYPHAESTEVDELMTTTTPSRHSIGKKYLRHRTPKIDDDAIRSAEEGQIQSKTSENTKLKPMSRTRLHVLTVLVALMVLTVALSAYGAHLTGKTRISCTKGIVFAATGSLACLTVLSMLVARRALSEALLAGLLEFVFGFALLVELDDFM